jgi:hypothetical protein
MTMPNPRLDPIFHPGDGTVVLRIRGDDQVETTIEWGLGEGAGSRQQPDRACTCRASAPLPCLTPYRGKVPSRRAITDGISERGDPKTAP